MVERELAAGERLMVQQANSFVDGLTARPWHEPGKRKWAKRLQQKWTVVRDELAAALAEEEKLLEQGNNVWAGAVDSGAGAEYGADWKTLVLCDRTVWDPVNSQIFPRTCELLHKSKVPLVEAFFAKMPPGTSISAHSDMCNFVLTCHLGIDIPEGQCSLTVGNETREWTNGGLFLFDTSILHEAENRAPVTRYILMLRVYHDELTMAERSALKLIFDCLDEPDLVEDPQALVEYKERRRAAEEASRQAWEPALAARKPRSKGKA